jgi:CD109 antigen
LSITISTSRAVYNAEQPVRIRVLFLTTALKPYEGIVDLFIIDPDGYVIRKWNSKELNVGVLTEVFVLPEFPKVGFWTVRVNAKGQIEELGIKVEKHYLPQAYELVAAMPNFVLDTEEFIEAEIAGAFITERIAKGNIFVRWLAKKIDYHTPMFNDTVVFRQVLILNIVIASLAKVKETNSFIFCKFSQF